MANVNVSYTQMQDAASRLRAGRQEIDDQLARLRAMIEQLVRDGFVTDRAATEFDASYREFTQGASSVIEGLDGMGAYLDTAARTFQDTDEQLASALKR